MFNSLQFMNQIVLEGSSLLAVDHTHYFKYLLDLHNYLKYFASQSSTPVSKKVGWTQSGIQFCLFWLHLHTS